jgi:hypothetical protein
MVQYENAPMGTTPGEAAIAATYAAQTAPRRSVCEAKDALNWAQLIRQSRTNKTQLKPLKTNDGAYAYPSIFEGCGARVWNTQNHQSAFSLVRQCYNRASPRARLASDIWKLPKGLFS